MRLRFLKAWQQYSVGDIIEPISAAYAETLVLSGKCKPIREVLTLKGQDDYEISDGSNGGTNNDSRSKNKSKHRNNRR